MRALAVALALALAPVPGLAQSLEAELPSDTEPGTQEAEVIIDDTLGAAPALANVRPQPRSPRVAAMAGIDAYESGDYVTALREWRPLAEQGNAWAQTFLGMMYDEGFGVPEDLAEAFRWYRAAAEQGNAWAQLSLGGMYEGGLGVQQDYAEAVRWYRAAAEQGTVEAQANLGVMYANGRSLPQDYVEAVRWYRAAAERGHAGAQFNLGELYARSNTPGVPQDYTEAVRWYRAAAEQGVECRRVQDHTLSLVKWDDVLAADRFFLSTCITNESL